jgi:hypothetical protein
MEAQNRFLSVFLHSMMFPQVASSFRNGASLVFPRAKSVAIGGANDREETFEKSG